MQQTASLLVFTLQLDNIDYQQGVGNSIKFTADKIKIQVHRILNQTVSTHTLITH